MAAVLEATVFYEPGRQITCLATGAIVAGTFVKISATRAAGDNISVVTCGAGQAAFGVALFACASGALVTVQPINGGGVVGVVVGTGGVTFGQEVESDATGQAIAFATGKILGMATSTVTATNTCGIALGR